MHISAQTESGEAPDAHRQPPFILHKPPCPSPRVPGSAPPSPPPTRGPSPGLRAPPEPVTPPARGCRRGCPHPRPGHRGPGCRASQPARRGEVPARPTYPPQGPASPRRALPEPARNKREGKALRNPLPQVSDPANGPLAPAPRGLPDRSHVAGPAPRSPRGKEGETPPYSPTVSSPSAVYLTVPPAYRAPPSWTHSPSPFVKRSAPAAASATRKSPRPGAAPAGDLRSDNRQAQPRRAQEALPLMTDGADRPRKEKPRGAF